MKKIAILRCLITSASCAGAGCLRALYEKDKPLRSSKKGLWRKLTSDEMLKPYKGQMSVSAELYFSPEQLKQRHVQSGKIKFYDAQGLYGTVVVDVINSRAK